MSTLSLVNIKSFFKYYTRISLLLGSNKIFYEHRFIDTVIRFIEAKGNMFSYIRKIFQ